MLILVACIDGQTVEDLAAGLRETLRQVEAGELTGQESTPEKSYHFKITPARIGTEPTDSPRPTVIP